MFNSFQEGKLLPLRGMQPINQIAAAFTAIYIETWSKTVAHLQFFLCFWPSRLNSWLFTQTSSNIKIRETNKIKQYVESELSKHRSFVWRNSLIGFLPWLPRYSSFGCRNFHVRFIHRALRKNLPKWPDVSGRSRRLSCDSFENWWFMFGTPRSYM